MSGRLPTLAERTPREYHGSALSTPPVALALIHHLAIANNVPLPRIAQFFAGCARTLIIEFVPREDSQAQRLLSTREDVFPRYTQDEFEAAFSVLFETLERQPLPGTARTVYAMRLRE